MMKKVKKITMKRILTMVYKALLLTFVFSLPSVHAKENTCVTDGKIKYFISAHEEKQIIGSYCFNQKKKTILTQRCMYGDECTLSKKVNQKVALKLDSFSNPLYKACQVLGRKPYKANFSHHKKWTTFKICLFPDESLIDLDSLYRKNQIDF